MLCCILPEIINNYAIPDRKKIDQKNTISDFKDDIKSEIERRKISEGKSRQHIAYAVVGGYIFLLFLNVVIPVWIYVFSKKEVTLSEVKDLTLVISTAISGMAGVSGFIMGYYFKSREDEDKSK